MNGSCDAIEEAVMIVFFPHKRMATNLLLGGKKRDFVVIRDDIYKEGGVVGGEGGYYMVEKIF